MLRFLVRRIALGIVVMFLVTLSVFLLFFSGNPRAVASRLAGKQGTAEQRDLIYHNLGLDRPVLEQFWSFLKGLVLHFDLGTDYFQGRQVTEVIQTDLPITASLVLGAAIIWLFIGVTTGVYAATHPRSITDRVLTALALFFYSVPVFVLGFGLIYLFYYQFTKHDISSFFPVGGYEPLANPYEWFRHLILPWIALALISAAAYTRLSRTSMLEVLSEDYIRTARAKGISERRVVYRHALRAALTPITTQFGVDVAIALGGAILTENAFGLTGLGYESVRAIENQDLPIILGIVIVAALAVVVMNIIVDLLYAVLDPRVQLH